MRGECEMDHGELTAKDAPSLESVHEVKLEALLNDLVKREGKIRAARTLGVNYKTVARSMKNGRLSVHLREALMTRLIDQREGEADDGESEQVEATEALGEELLDDMEELRETVENVRAEYARRLGELDKRLAEVETGLGGRMASGPEGVEPHTEEDGVDGAAHEERRPPRRGHFQEYRRTHPSVITMEPQPGDEEVFGEAWPLVITMEPQPGDEEVFGEAWPLVDEWRRLRTNHPAEGGGVEWLTNEERLRELEIALVGEHELTMPPSTYRWDSFERRSQVRWRTETLERVRRDLFWAHVRRWIRRILTFNLWRD